MEFIIIAGLIVLLGAVCIIINDIAVQKAYDDSVKQSIARDAMYGFFSEVNESFSKVKLGYIFAPVSPPDLTTGVLTEVREPRKKVLFVGHSPSKAKRNAKPFAGTRSGKTVDSWVDYLDCEATLCNSSSTPGARPSTKDLQALKLRCEGFSKIVALGEQASKTLGKIGVPHHKLPHPSGLNRKLNDKDWVQRQLDGCKEYIG